jgi:thioredoxin-like negative regulator of GroEL
MESQKEMTNLPSQEFFESLIKRNISRQFEPLIVILFTASWCGPCRRIDKSYLMELDNRIKWYKCDVDENDYTPGYAGVRNIPAFLAIVNGQPQPLFVSSDTMKIAQWIQSGFKQT